MNHEWGRRAICAPVFYKDYDTCTPYGSLVISHHSKTSLFCDLFVWLLQYLWIISTIIEQYFACCLQLQAPLVKVTSHQSIEVEVQGASFEITKRSGVTFTPLSFLTFIRTDKPVYKQGQTGDPSPSLSLSLSLSFSRSLSFLHNRLTVICRFWKLCIGMHYSVWWKTLRVILGEREILLVLSMKYSGQHSDI